MAYSQGTYLTSGCFNHIPGRKKIVYSGISSVIEHDFTGTLTCVGIHSGRVEPASPIELTTPRIVALQTRRSQGPFSIMRSRRLAVWRGAPGLP